MDYSDIFTLIIGIMIAFFFRSYILESIKWLLSKTKNLGLVVIMLAFLNLVGPLIAYTIFHLNTAIILAIAPYSTAFTVNVVSTGFMGLFLATIGILVYKLLK